MSEEEIKGILNAMHGNLYMNKKQHQAIRGILDLYNKQKERIKELETINQMNRYRIDVIDERELISKDKIKKLLKEVKEEKNKAMKSFAEKPINSDFVIDGAIGQELGYVIGLIEELLEE